MCVFHYGFYVIYLYVLVVCRNISEGREEQYRVFAAFTI